MVLYFPFTLIIQLLIWNYPIKYFVGHESNPLYINVGVLKVTHYFMGASEIIHQCSCFNNALLHWEPVKLYISVAVLKVTHYFMGSQ